MRQVLQAKKKTRNQIPACRLVRLEPFKYDFFGYTDDIYAIVSRHVENVVQL